MREMNVGLLLHILPVLFLGNFASCRSPRQTDGGQNSTTQNNVGNQMSNEIISGSAKEDSWIDLKPCRRHLNRVESIIFPSKFRPFIPLCDSNGYYLPLQCHQSSGYCWCVNKNGNMKSGTRTKGPIDCGLKALKTPCEAHRLRSLKHKMNSFRPVFIPRCNEDGYYAPMQCTAENKYCWCVDKSGNTKKGSRTKGLADCSKSTNKEKSNNNYIGDAFAADGPCSQHKKRRNNLATTQGTKQQVTKLFDPTCDEDGFYAKKQCHSSYCWCSDPEGNLIAGSRKKGDVDCESSTSSGPTKPPKNRCFTERLQGLKSSLKKNRFVPLCSPDGSYAPLQCNTKYGYCWCADKWGKEIKNTKTKRTPKCLIDKFTNNEKKPCYELKKYIKQLPTAGNINIPVCKHKGLFRSLQCSRDKRYCWCVEQNGMEIKGTMMFGKPKCPERFLNMTYVKAINGPCMRHKEKRKKLYVQLRRNLFNPRCNKNGFYDVKQCHGKYCWCSDRNGKMMRGTRTKGNIDCVAISKPRVKPCLANRLRALRISLEKKPYVAQCEPNGDYTPLQCNTYTGVCWCVDERGKERVGSRTKRTPNCFASAFNTVDDGPCDILKSFVLKLPPKNKVNVPICEGNGFFQPAQCSKTNGFCWCVMHDGTEVQGSITFGKPECHEKRLPAVPRLHGPCNEHLAHVSNMVSTERKDVYTPLCDNEGYYAPLQCNNDTTSCWCVDRYGSMIKGTRMKGKLPVCDEKVLKPCVAFKKRRNDISESSAVNDVYDAVCTENGHFAPLQCNVDSGNCWCVDMMGKAVTGTTLYQRPYCGSAQRKCEMKRRSILSEDNPTEAPPSCDVHGYYSPLQCDHLTKKCWCTDREGKEIEGTRTDGIANCGQLPRPCDEQFSSVLNHDNLFGVLIPQCDSQGYYANIQCHEKTKVCWCANKYGVEIPGTKTVGKPNCVF